MSKIVDVQIPNIGDYESVDVIEIFVKPGDPINKEDSLITLESEKATMEIPSPYQGTVKELKVAIGDKLSAGALILTMEVTSSAKATKVKKAPVEKAAAGKATGRGSGDRHSNRALHELTVAQARGLHGFRVRS